MKQSEIRHLAGKVFVSVVLLAGLSAGSVRAEAEAPKPGPEHAKLGILVGDWTYEGKTADTKESFTGTITTRFVLGGFFVEDKWEETAGAARLSGVQMFGYDAAAKGYFVNGYSSDGSRYAGGVTIEGDVLTSTWVEALGQGATRLVKGVWTFDPDQSGFTAVWQTSRDGGRTWTPWLEYRAKKAAK